MKQARSLLSLMVAVALVFGLAMVPATADSAPKEVQFWYLWTGAEGDNVAKVAEDFNASQSEYKVVSLSVPDMQKITVAIASGSGPDITDDFNTNVASYASKGIMMALDSFVEADGYPIEDYVPITIEACKFDEQLYALPLSLNLMALYYNKDLFEAAGIEPPTTDEELMEAAYKLTTLNEDGSIDVLGFPDFPNVYYLENFTYALGGSNISEDGTTLTPDNDGARRALEMIVEYRTQYGVDNVVKYNSGGKYMDPTDPFLAGKQAMRVDGPWVASVLQQLGVSVNYGIVPIPYLAGHEDQAMSALASNSIAYIPATAKEPQGAWEFMKFWCSGPGAKAMMVQNGAFPALSSLMETDEFKSMYDFASFGKIAASPNLKLSPIFGNKTEYYKVISDQAELAETLKISVDDALKAMVEQSQGLLD